MSPATSKPDLSPCPFCGGQAEISTTRFQVYCLECGAEGACYASDLGAIHGWNKRLLSSETETRETVIAECMDVAHDAIHDAIYEMTECERVKSVVNDALSALKNAAPQVPVDTNSGCLDQGRAQDVAPAVAAPVVAPSAIGSLVDRFLAWPLPDSVASDDCATVRDYGVREGWPKRCGTNLLTADEARQMLEYVLNAAPQVEDASTRTSNGADKAGPPAVAAPPPRQRSTPSSMTVSEARELARRITLRVAEIPDRTSPEDQPDMMLVTPNELRAIVEDEIETRCTRSATAVSEPASTKSANK